MVNEIKSLIEKHKIIAIIRNVSPERLIHAADALYKGGIRLMEVTFNQKNPDCVKETSEMIEMLSKHFQGDICVGAGTVMNIKQVEAAAKAGAKYIISPHTDLEVIKRTVELDMVSIPGAMTPSEIVMAYNAGAGFVKLFPAGELGVNYVKSVCSPLNYIPMLAVGGIDENNMQDFLNTGIKGFGIGSNIVKSSYINGEKYDELTILAKKYTCQI